MFGDLAKAGTKAMGGARFGLLNVLPGALVTAVTVALVRAHAYDFGRPVDLGAVLPGKSELGPAVVFALAALVGGILLRPFERVLVQQLEGYWAAPSPLAPLRTAAVELHRRRRDNAFARLTLNKREELKFGRGPSSLADLAAQERRMGRQARAVARDRQLYQTYPDDRGLPRRPRKPALTHLMPTRLGNVLRRGEEMAGGRYGLDAMTVYPRIYPYISERLAEAMARQLELLAATASLSVSFGLLSALTLPLLGRLDWWSVTPFAAAALSVLAYRGAVVTARYTGTVFSTVFDLHRFDLTAAMRYPLPETAAEEFDLNQRLTSYLHDAETHTLHKDDGLGDKKFSHPREPTPPTGQPLIPPAGDGAGSA
ncbi:hypothetical protein [Streptomyces sp. GESEQ-35]|uniref:hypothetical protein n=1 Tax=Streptomyces sp. GESEQ-35 TaxID=2812657 RepID=UPI001B3263A2|nr:hypothetical protein [Streptomyces sp. GESEQ-35]